jgi:RND superfamily putative drug exporter
MALFLSRLGRFCARHRRWVLVGWVLLLIVLALLAKAGDGSTIDNFTVPGTQSQQATDLLKARIPALSGTQTQVVFQAPSGKTIVAERSVVEHALSNLRQIKAVTVVSDPFSTTSPAISKDGRYALATVTYSVDKAHMSNSTLDKLDPAVAVARSAGVQTQFSGAVYPGFKDKASEVPEAIGLIIAFVILLFTFGSLAGVLLPLITALFSVAVSAMAVRWLSSGVDVSSIAAPLTAMLGLATGIDYSLFVASRHRANLMQGMEMDDSIGVAVGKSGSAVLFAASTVILALCGLTVIGIPFLSVMALCAAGGVLISLLAALTLLPALLGFAGPHLIHFTIRREQGSAERAAAHPDGTVGAHWARFVVHRRGAALVGGIVLLLVIAIPIHDLQLGLPGPNTQPTSNTGHKAYALIAKGYGVGANAPLSVVVNLEHPTSAGATSQIVSRLAAEPDVVLAKPIAQANHTAVIQVTPATGPNDDRTSDLVTRIRDQAAAIKRQTGAVILVGGTTAANIDTSSKLSSALPVFLIIIILLATILLTLAFRTVLVPVTSVIGFLLSAAAGLGAEVAFFQWGWAHSQLHVTPSQTVSYIPIMLLAIIFGLSCDYEVFVVSRIREAFIRTGDAQEAVKAGTGSSVRVVTAAALIMFCVFAAFLILHNITIEAIGFGLAVAVLLDAFVVRLTLVPAVMSFSGKSFWDRPHWLVRHIPNLDIEGESLDTSSSGGTKPTPPEPVPEPT